MPTPPSAPPKAITQVWRPELTELPRLHLARRGFRAGVRLLARVLTRLLTQASVSGLEHFPRRGPALIVLNHLGDTDTAILLAALPIAPEALGKVELYDFPVLGILMEWYGTIWLHRGRPDRRALRCALAALAQGRLVAVTPEGRYTLTRGLEEGSPGAAWLAIKAQVPIVPITLTGTENAGIYGSLRRFRRPRLTLTVGEPFDLGARPEAPEWLRAPTRQIMESLARPLPAEYRGVYQYVISASPESPQVVRCVFEDSP